MLKLLLSRGVALVGRDSMKYSHTLLQELLINQETINLVLNRDVMLNAGNVVAG